MTTRSVCALVTALAACAPAAGSELRVPSYEPAGQTKARVAKSSLHPLVVEWPASDRAALEALRGRGVVVVRYVQGEIELLPQCRARASYRFTKLTPKVEGLVIRDRDELQAAMPIHTAGLEARLARQQQLHVQMTLVGVYDTAPHTWRAADLDGECARATHVVSALTVGAFDIVASARASTSAGARFVAGAAASASRDAALETVSRDGNHDACAADAPTDGAPAGCGALLRVDLLPLQVPVQGNACAPDDAACMAARAQGGCAAGFVRRGAVCEAVTPDRPTLIRGLGGRD